MKPPLIIAHRGASHDAPENTLAAIHLAWKMESDAVEIDIRLTADGEIVVIHDASTTRTTGVEHMVAETTLAELKTLDAGAFKGTSWCGEQIPTLCEVLQAVPHGKKIFVEIKTRNRALLPLLQRELEAWTPSRSQLHLMAFDEELLAEAKAALPEIPCFWLTSAYHRTPEENWPETTRQLLATRHARGFDGLSVGVHQAKDLPALCRELRSCAEVMPVLVWTVNEPETARTLSGLPLHGLITDRPDLIRSSLAGA